MGNLPEAEKDARKAVEVFPRSSPAHIELGDALRLQRRYKEAEVEYLEALNLYKGQDTAYFELGRIAVLNDDSEKALGFLKKAIELNPQVIGQLKRDEDFKEVLSRPDFKKLLNPGGRN